MTFPYIGNNGAYDEDTAAAKPLDSALVVEHFPMSTPTYWTRSSQCHLEVTYPVIYVTCRRNSHNSDDLLRFC